MPTSSTVQDTDFTRDALGRYVCNGLDEALASALAHPFEVIVIGGGSFGPIFAQHLMYRDSTRARRRGRVNCRGRRIRSERYSGGVS